MAPDKVIDLAPLGVTGSGGSIGFVPPGFPGAGSMKLVSWGGGGWYHCEFAPDGNGTFNITSASLRATVRRARRHCFCATRFTGISP